MNIRDIKHTNLNKYVDKKLRLEYKERRIVKAIKVFLLEVKYNRTIFILFLS